MHPNRLRKPKPSTPMPMTGQPSSTSPMPPKKHAVPGGRERGVGGEPLCAWSGVAALERWRGVSRPARAERAPTFELAFLEEETEGLVHADDHHDTRKEQDLQTQSGGREQSSAARSRRGPLGTRRTLPMARSPLSKNIIMPSTMKSKPAPVRPIPIPVHDARRTWGLLAAVGRAHSTTGGCGLRRTHFCSRPWRQL